MASDSVKVCDLEIEKLAEIAECWDDIEAVLGSYVDIMKCVHEEAIKSGDIHIAVENLYFISKRFHDYADGLGSEAAKNAKALVSKVEAVDLSLYNEV